MSKRLFFWTGLTWSNYRKTRPVKQKTSSCVYIYRRIPVLGKHTKRVTCGAWNKRNLLALGSDDHFLTVSNAEGDTLFQLSVHGSPSNIQFSEVKSDERHNMAENTVSFLSVIFVLKQFYSSLSYIWTVGRDFVKIFYVSAQHSVARRHNVLILFIHASVHVSQTLRSRQIQIGWRQHF